MTLHRETSEKNQTGKNKKHSHTWEVKLI